MTVAIFVPKRLKKSELYAIALFSIVLGFFTDITFDLKYNLYGYFSPGVQFAGFLPILLLFPSSGVLFMNFYPFKKSLLYQFFYIFCWTIFCLFFEFLSIKSGYFYHNGWKYWHSAFTYPYLFLLHLLHLRFFRGYND
ncbi:CBO0543 family protein [Metabacillus herbersteinensis]|uniref:CBO0543 family protein n=1 Tax=Metabacillus herbersteinensis TaxID=283816 RepID=A0ABV6GJ68_9BACI